MLCIERFVTMYDAKLKNVITQAKLFGPSSEKLGKVRNNFEVNEDSSLIKAPPSLLFEGRLNLDQSVFKSSQKVVITVLYELPPRDTTHCFNSLQSSIRLHISL